MDYVLAKELKDVGFPQTGFIGGHFYSKDGIRWQSSIERSELTYGDIKEPTLEELIEACGEEFGILGMNDVKEWFAVSRGDEHPNDPAVTKIGSTPTEAVARLWLALNKKTQNPS